MDYIELIFEKSGINQPANDFEHKLIHEFGSSNKLNKYKKL